MALYSIYADTKIYRYIGFDSKQSKGMFGKNIHDQFDVNFEAKRYSDKWTSPLSVDFSDDGSGFHGDVMPDISEHNGRLFLSQKAYEVLKPLIEHDGEFLPVSYDEESGYMFNPLSIAETVDGVDETLTKKNEWGDLINLAFHEDKVKSFAIFRTNVDDHISAFCQQSVKDAIENADLKGVFFTVDLGNRYTQDQAEKLQNG